MRKFSLISPALLVIDMQRYFLEPGAEAFIESAPAIVPNVIRLIKKFRDEKSPVIFTRIAYKKGEPTGQMGNWWNNKLPWEGEPSAELISELAPTKNEFIITKTRYSAFEKTGLEKFLREKSIKTVIICGVMTHLCVETTARHAFLLDFQPIVISDACVAKTEEHHKAALLNLAHGFAHVVITSQIITPPNPLLK